MGNHFVLMVVVSAFACFIAGALITVAILSKGAKKKRSGKYFLRRVLLAYLIGLVLFILVGIGYLMAYKKPGEASEMALTGDDIVSVTAKDYGYYMDGPGEDTALVFYPGGKVAAECYAPLLRNMAENGVDIYLMDMPANLAFLKVNAADLAMGDGSYEHWYVGGHSLGGVAASLYANSHSDALDGVVLISSYPSKEIPEGMRMISVNGSLDTVLDAGTYESSRELWPSACSEYTISGGNHTGFADCSLISGDTEATISPQRQQELAAKAVAFFLHPYVPAEETQEVTPEPEPEPEPGKEPLKEGVQLFAARVNDNSELWDSGRGYEFPAGEEDVYTSMGRYCNMRILSIGSQEHSENVVLFLHGGAYLSDFDNGYYYPAVKQITMETGYEVIVPQYPLLTGFNFTHAYTLLQSFYYRLVAEYGSSHVIVMGDSAGGSLAAGLCMQAAENGWDLPSQLVLSSPWVDLMITHPETDRYQELDKDLDAYMLRLYAEMWAAGEDPSDYHLSPMYGDVTVLPYVTLYYGDSELFTPMEQLFYEKLTSNGVACEQIIGPGMGHNYVITHPEDLSDLCRRMVERQNTILGIEG